MIEKEGQVIEEGEEVEEGVVEEEDSMGTLKDKKVVINQIITNLTSVTTTDKAIATTLEFVITTKCHPLDLFHQQTQT